MRCVLRELETHVLRLGEEAERLPPALATHTGLFYPAERCPQIANHPTIDPRDASLEVRGDAVRAVERARPHHRRQSVRRTVRERDRFFFCLEAVQRHHWAKDFFLARAACRRKSLDHSRRQEPTPRTAAGR